MKVHEIIAAGRSISFEFGPPRTPEAEARLDRTLVELEPLGPSFVSVTYGAGGSTRGKTREIVEHIHDRTSMTPMPHLTCVGHTRDQVADIVGGYRDAGLVNLLALAGDPPDDGQGAAGDFRYAVELIELARELGDFSIGVAAFPEVHPKSPDRQTDRRHLADKLRIADFGITQFFFSVEPYFRMMEELTALGVDKPVIPGVLLFVNVPSVHKMSAMNNATVPDELRDRLARVEGEPAEVRKLAVDVSTRLIQELLDGGVPGVHLYTMNFSRGTQDVFANLGIGSHG
ncbi:MAG: methylenetetrahydrofolate reductase [Actinomycetota bacterium]|nr:methylenetetrahydrofolate reductase [Actinomycetota bacterium]